MEEKLRELEEVRELRIEKARNRKVARLLAVFWKHGFTAAQVARMNPDQWKIAATAAGINPPSETTIAMLWTAYREVADS